MSFKRELFKQADGEYMAKVTDEKGEVYFELVEEEYEKRAIDLKSRLVAKMRADGVPADKIIEFSENVNNEEDLARIGTILGFMKLANERIPPSTSSVDSPPRGSVVQLPIENSGDYRYRSVREGIDDLYARVAKGDKTAKVLLDKMWEITVDQLKRKAGSIKFAISECGNPDCRAGIMEGEVCPFCGWNPEEFKSKGGEIF